jgi:hypothetical protein
MTTQPSRPRHKTVKARDLRPDDLMQCGVSTNYIQVTSVTVMPGGRVDVRTGNGEPGQLLDSDTDVSLSTFGMTAAEVAEDRPAMAAVRNACRDCAEVASPEIIIAAPQEA